MSNWLKMAEIHSIRTLLDRGWSCRRIARELGLDRATVRRHKAAASNAATNPTPGNPAENADGVAGGAGPPAADAPQPPRPGPDSRCAVFEPVIVEMLAAGLSAKRIHQDLAGEHGFVGSYASVKRFVRRLGAQTPLPFRRMECGPGEEAQADFGQGALTTKPGCKRKVRPHLLRIVLSCSRKAYSETVWRQSTEDLIRCLENAFWAFGGVPKVLVIDNLRAAVDEPDWYDPKINHKFGAFAAHYGCVVMPTKPYTPRHKGKVESGVNYVQENAVKGREFNSLAEQNAFLQEWERNVADARIHGTTKKQVRQVFEEQERCALLPLPSERFPFFHEAERIVARDGHIAVEQGFYSAPPEFLGRTVWVRWDSRLLRVFDQRFRQIALHLRVGPGQFSTQPTHISSKKISGIEHGAVSLLHRAAKVGPEAGKWSQELIARRGIQGVRTLQGFLSLVTKHPWPDLERACRVALSHGTFRLKVLRRLLKDPGEQPQIEFADTHPLIRDMDDYGRLVHGAFEESPVVPAVSTDERKS